MTESPAERGDVVGEFSSNGMTFSVRRVPRGEFEVDAREGDAPSVAICRIYPYSSTAWFSTWTRDSQRPWIDMTARQLINAKQPKTVQ